MPNDRVARVRVDAHQHFWRRARGDYAWLREDDSALAPLLRDFAPADLIGLLEAHDVKRTVVVQAAATTQETDFILELAAGQALIGGVVGWVDFEAPDVEGQLLRRKAQPKFKGVRPMLQDMADSDWIGRPASLSALQLLQRLDLRLDALVRPQHLEPLLRALATVPELKAVVDHAAKPKLGQPLDLVAFNSWSRDLRALAKRTSTLCKFSGLLTEVAAATPISTVAQGVMAVRPVWDALLEWFGPQRLMWGSDWPVLLLASDYGHWVAVCETLIGELSSSEQEQIWAGNATRFYALPPSTATFESLTNSQHAQ